jgi:multidrug efflux pump subunit AcrA (membrane-fusion protein)
MNRPLNLAVRVIAPLVVVGLALGVANRFVQSKPQAQRAERRVSAPLVEVMPAILGPQTLTVEAMGTVRPAHLLVVQPQVSGAIIDHHPALVPGGLIAEGETLVTIDARDYELAVERQQAQVARARLDLRVENGRQAIAEQEWDSMAQELVMMDRADESLARREPQVAAARAGVKSAVGAVEMAQLSLDRTRISAPFNAVVREEAVEVGQIVGPGFRLATLAGLCPG